MFKLSRRIDGVYPFRTKYAYRYLAVPTVKQYLREPYELGYPQGLTHEIRNEITEIKKKVFDKRTPAETFETEVKDKKWEELSILERFQYTQQLQVGRYKFNQPKPKPETGFDLFKSQVRHRYAKPILKEHWDGLTDVERAQYIESPHWDYLHQQRLRIWQGYEIVEYLKIRGTIQQQFNPYPFLGLYPWEIIKDKLLDMSRRKTIGSIYDFEKDIYDVLILEALVTKVPDLYKFYISYARDITKPPTKKEFSMLGPSVLEPYITRRNKRIQHANEYNPTKKVSNWSTFLQQKYRRDPQYQDTSFIELEKIASIEWQTLTKEEKDRYSTTLEMSSASAKDIRLNEQVDHIMKYIYEVGSVAGTPSGFNWKSDMMEKTKGFIYLYRMYGEVYISSKKVEK